MRARGRGRRAVRRGVAQTGRRARTNLRVSPHRHGRRGRERLSSGGGRQPGRRRRRRRRRREHHRSQRRSARLRLRSGQRHGRPGQRLSGSAQPFCDGRHGDRSTAALAGHGGRSGGGWGRGRSGLRSGAGSPAVGLRRFARSGSRRQRSAAPVSGAGPLPVCTGLGERRRRGCARGAAPSDCGGGGEDVHQHLRLVVRLGVDEVDGLGRGRPAQRRLRGQRRRISAGRHSRRGMRWRRRERQRGVAEASRCRQQRGVRLEPGRTVRALLQRQRPRGLRLRVQGRGPVELRVDGGSRRRAGRGAVHGGGVIVEVRGRKERGRRKRRERRRCGVRR